MTFLNKHMWSVVAIASLLVVLFYAVSKEREWIIQPSSVGDVTLGAFIPLFVLTQNPSLYSGMYGDYVPEVGLYLANADLTIAVEYFIIVRALYPGAKIKTAAGTGVGSTLEELRLAHGRLDITSIPEPYMCSVSSPKLPDVYFQFTTCDAAQKGEGVVRVVLWK